MIIQLTNCDGKTFYADASKISLIGPSQHPDNPNGSVIITDGIEAEAKESPRQINHAKRVMMQGERDHVEMIVARDIMFDNVPAKIENAVAVAAKMKRILAYRLNQIAKQLDAYHEELHNLAGDYDTLDPIFMLRVKLADCAKDARKLRATGLSAATPED